jgi:hypothetical protein
MSEELEDILPEDLDNELDELVNELKDNPPNRQLFAPINEPTTVEISTDADLAGYINNSAQKSNNILLQVILNFANTVGDDPDRAAALAALIKSNTDILKILNDQLGKTRDNATKLAIQKMKTEAVALQETIQNEGSVVTPRDQLFKELFKDATDADFDDEEES